MILQIRGALKTRSESNTIATPSTWGKTYINQAENQCSRHNGKLNNENQTREHQNKSNIGTVRKTRLSQARASRVPTLREGSAKAPTFREGFTNAQTYQEDSARELRMVLRRFHRCAKGSAKACTSREGSAKVPIGHPEDRLQHPTS